ncbi:MAG: hypothetical protein DME68_06450 [Verrucomicrobia bacterium]|nr:MAG: hypothetical protein DME68_06450 [Verrucomicrobiota bacterium]
MNLLTGSVPARVFRYRKRFTCKSSKTFHFLRSTLRFYESRICNSHYLHSRDVRQVRQIRAPARFSEFSDWMKSPARS